MNLQELRDHLIETEKWNNTLRIYLPGHMLFEILLAASEVSDNHPLIVEFADQIEAADLKLEKEVQEYESYYSSESDLDHLLDLLGENDE